MYNRDILAGAVAAALLGVVRVASQSTCSSVEVTGGATPGTYIDSNEEEDGRPVFVNFDNGTSILVFQSGFSLLGRRLEEAAGNAELQDKLTHAKAMDETLDTCLTGVWINGQGTSLDDYNYPIYVVPDCSDHPADISTTWLRLDCSTCLPPDDADVTVECIDDPTPAPTMMNTMAATSAQTMAATSAQTMAQTMAATMASTMTSTMASTPDATTASSTMMTPAPAAGSRGLPSATPAPTSLADAELEVGDCAEITVTEGGYPGVYAYAGTLNDRPAYGTTEGGVGFYLLDDFLRRRLAADEGKSGEAHWKAALADARESKETCTTGAWAIAKGSLPETIDYPVYGALDCSDDVFDVTTTWLEVSSDDISTAVTADPQPVITCSAFVQDNTMAGSSTPTAAPTAAPTKVDENDGIIPASTPSPTTSDNEGSESNANGAARISGGMSASIVTVAAFVASFRFAAARW